MKKTLKFLSMMMLVMVLPMVTACKHGDDDPFDINKAYGTWMCTDSEDYYQGYKQEDLFVGAQITINPDGTFTSTSSSFGLVGTYTYKGNQITASSSSGTFILNVKFDDNYSEMEWRGTTSNGVSFEYDFRRVLQ